MIYMFNELSLSKVNTIGEARLVFENFVKSVIRAKKLGFSELRLHENSLESLYNLALVDDYRTDAWLNDGLVNVDLKNAFRQIFTTYPLITEAEVNEKEKYEWSVFKKCINENETQVWGLGAAYILGTLGLSLATHLEWENAAVQIDCEHMDLDGKVEDVSVSVKHFSSTEILNTHINWVIEEQEKTLAQSRDIWNRRIELLPYLSLGPEVEVQIEKIGMSKQLSKIFNCLAILNQYSYNWNIGNFDFQHFLELTKLDASSESASTMQKYGALRKFKSGKGVRQQFDLHIKLSDIRIYFLPNETDKSLIIGYIGKHLRTSKY